jgi:hypothetical protein
MKPYIKGLITGILLASISFVLLAASNTVQATFSSFKFKVDDNNPVEVEALVYNGNSYYHIRKIGEIVGFDVGYDNETRTILINTESSVNEVSQTNEQKAGDTVEMSFNTPTEIEQSLLNAAKEGNFQPLFDAWNNGIEFNINAQDPETGNTLLHFAITNKQYHETVAYQILRRYENDIDVNITNNEGKNIIHYSVIYRFPFVAQLHEIYGGNIYAKDNDGKYPIDYADSLSPERTYLKGFKYEDR